MFKKISIIGCGLIGSSLLRIINRKKLAKKIEVYDKSLSVQKFLKKKKLIKKINNDIGKVVENSDLVIISTPLSAYNDVLSKIKKFIKNNSILTDTGSAKENINKTVLNLNFNEKKINWIASHPIAGTEMSGPESGTEKLFNKRWCILCPSAHCKKKSLFKLENFWKKIGSKVKVMDFNEHDKILALSSHLPHVIAYNIVKTAVMREGKINKDIIKYSAGGLRDFTRIASSDPIMWRDIFIENSKNIIKVIDEFIKNLEDLKKNISENDIIKLEELFKNSKKIRSEIVSSGQDTSEPDFGRKKN
tara:strand:+ start:688 stop:1599 length:912 start_codon:yes stop_codon:yes gene_type:complete